MAHHALIEEERTALETFCEGPCLLPDVVALLEGCNLSYARDAALAFCDVRGIDSVAMLAEVGMEEDFIAALPGLKPAKAIQLRIRIHAAAEPAPLRRSVSPTKIIGHGHGRHACRGGVTLIKPGVRELRCTQPARSQHRTRTH